MTTERRFAFVRVAAGDYLLPTNDKPDEGFVFTTQVERWLDDGWHAYTTGFQSRKDALAQVSELVGGNVPYR